MLYFPSANLAFYHIHKTGGTSMSHAFRRLFPDAIELDRWPHHPLEIYFGKLRELGVDPSTVTILTLIRDPLDHTVSIYHYWRQSRESHNTNVRAARQLSFRDFCQLRLTPLRGQARVKRNHRGEYRACLEVDGEIPGNIQYIRLERWREDLQKLNLDWAAELHLERMNASVHDEALSYHDETTIRLVRDRYSWVYDEGYYAEPVPPAGESDEPAGRPGASQHTGDESADRTTASKTVAAPSLIFIAGTDGPSTTLVLKLLSSAPGACSLGGNYIDVPDCDAARTLAQEFETVNREVWDRNLDLAASDAARGRWRKVFEQIRQSQAFSGKTHFIFKRTSPFGANESRRIPDLWDLFDLDPNAKVIVVYRNPLSVCRSAQLRGIDTDLRRLAVTMNEQLSLLALQTAALGPGRARVLSYKRLCDDPVKELSQLLALCGLPETHASDAVARERVEPGYDLASLEELDSDTRLWLRCFFHPGRRRQWATLEEADHR